MMKTFSTWSYGGHSFTFVIYKACNMLTIHFKLIRLIFFQFNFHQRSFYSPIYTNKTCSVILVLAKEKTRTENIQINGQSSSTQFKLKFIYMIKQLVPKNPLFVPFFRPKIQGISRIQFPFVKDAMQCKLKPTVTSFAFFSFLFGYTFLPVTFIVKLCNKFQGLSMYFPAYMGTMAGLLWFLH